MHARFPFVAMRARPRGSDGGGGGDGGDSAPLLDQEPRSEVVCTRHDAFAALRGAPLSAAEVARLQRFANRGPRAATLRLDASALDKPARAKIHHALSGASRALGSRTVGGGSGAGGERAAEGEAEGGGGAVVEVFWRGPDGARAPARVRERALQQGRGASDPHRGAVARAVSPSGPRGPGARVVRGRVPEGVAGNAGG